MGPILRGRFALTALFSVLLGAGAAAEEIDVRTAHERVKAGETVLIDVRTPAEWAATGVPEGAQRITIFDAQGSGGFVEKALAALDGDPDRPVALICRSGNRSRAATRLLRKNGFGQVTDVRGGMAGTPAESALGWVEADLPVSR